ncbi:MAG: AIR synthase-related protein [Nanoarchaeota archaeon]
MPKQTTYADARVNVDLGDDASKVLYNAAKQTWKNRKGRFGEVVELFSDFSGLRAVHVGGLPQGTYMNLGFDGVGTKMELGERIGKHNTVAYDLFAMVCDDAVVRGAEPVLVGSILDVNSLGRDGESYIEFVKQLANGYICAAKAANVVVVNGEVAELGARVQGYGKFNYNWGAGIVWFAKKDRMFTGKEIQPIDSIVALKEEGFRSNGLSLVRKIMKQTYGDNWHEKDYNGKNLAELALTPSIIYSKAIVDMFGGFEEIPKAEVHGVAHITGGGIPGKLGRVLKQSGLSAAISDPFEPSEFVRYVQELGGVLDREAYRTWNMGQGMLVITPEPKRVIDVSSSYGIFAKEVGVIENSKDNPIILIKNRGAHYAKEPELVFDIR